MRVRRHGRSIMSALFCWQSALLFVYFWPMVANAVVAASKTENVAEQKILGSFTDGNLRTHGKEFQHVADTGTLHDHVSNAFKPPFPTSAPRNGGDVQQLPHLLSALHVMHSEFFTF